MDKKFVKDKNHNRYPAYCCEDIDSDLGARVKALEDKLKGLVAGVMPDGSVTLAKLAADARTYVRELNKGELIAEWIGTELEYKAHISENGGNPLPNVKYTITDKLKDHTIVYYESVDVYTEGVHCFVVRCGSNEYYTFNLYIDKTVDKSKSTIAKGFSPYEDDSVYLEFNRPTVSAHRTGEGYAPKIISYFRIS